MINDEAAVALQAVLAERRDLRIENETLKLNNQMLAQAMLKLGQAAVELEKQLHELRTGEPIPVIA